MDTQSKRSIWCFLMPTLEENHQEYVKNYLNTNNSKNGKRASKEKPLN